MAIPSQKSPAMEQFLDEQTKTLTGRTRTDSIKADICAWCGGPASEFKDNLSRREYAISGLCQKCQDKMFG